MKKLGVYSMVVLLLATGCSANEVDEVEEPKVEEVVEEEVELDRESRIGMAVLTMTDTYEGVAEIDYDEDNDIIQITPTDPDFIKEILYMVAGVTGTEDWDGMVESLQELSEALSGMVDEDLFLSLMNPENEDNTMLLIQDGNIIYNLSDDL